MFHKLEMEIFQEMRYIPARIYELAMQNFVDRLERVRPAAHLARFVFRRHFVKNDANMKTGMK